MALREITLRINGKTYSGRAEPRKTLADFIREDCGLTGTHLGCEHGVCGACTILLEGEAVRSCLLFAVQAEGADLMTVEGLAQGDHLHPIQQAYWEHHALQCGFCTPGFLMTIVAFLRDTPRPTEREIREGLAGNLCRCTGYQNIVKAVAAAAESLATGTVADALPAHGLTADSDRGRNPAGSAPTEDRQANKKPGRAPRPEAGTRRTPPRRGGGSRSRRSKR